MDWRAERTGGSDDEKSESGSARARYFQPKNGPTTTGLGRGGLRGEDEEEGGGKGYNEATVERETQRCVVLLGERRGW